MARARVASNSSSICETAARHAILLLQSACDGYLSLRKFFKHPQTEWPTGGLIADLHSIDSQLSLCWTSGSGDRRRRPRNTVSSTFFGNEDLRPACGSKLQLEVQAR